jgi:putative spermidine/putrescine transport system ATP-binding protein
LATPAAPATHQHHDEGASDVRLVDLRKTFGEVAAVDGVSLEIRAGEFFSLLGPSGCGKTTTLRMIAGLIEPTDGRVYFDADDVTFLPPRKRNIGFVFQTPALFPHLSVADNVAFGLSVKGMRKDAVGNRVDEMLAMVGLSGYGARLPAQLSGGQQQRVALARVLATDPRVLLFDEPLSALDRNLRDTLKYSILELQRRTGKTAVYVTHDQSEAFAISDRIVVMNAGRVEQIGSQTELYLEPRTQFVAEFIGANNALPGTVAAVASDDGVAGEAEPREATGHRRVTLRAGGLDILGQARDDLAVGDAVIAYLRPEDISVVDDGAAPTRSNAIEADVERVIFEGPTVQLRVRIGDQRLRVDVGGGRRLALGGETRTVRLEFDDVSVIRREAAS